MAVRVTSVDQDGAYAQMEHQLKNRIYCDTYCIYFEGCPLQPLSYLSDDRKCLMKMYGEPIRRTFLNLALKGEDGVVDEMLRCVFTFARKIQSSDNLKDLERYFDLLSRYHKVQYGEKGIQGDNVPALDVTIKRVGRDLPGVLLGDSDVAIPEHLVDEDQLSDPDSLFYNPEYLKKRGDGLLVLDPDSMD